LPPHKRGNLRLACSKVRIGDLELDGTTYNGVYSGPVLHVHPGDTMHIRLVNHLSRPTNIHFRIDVRAPLGDIEEWTVHNDTDDLHVFHIHQIGLQAVAVNGQQVPFAGHVDNIRIPERGSVTLRMPFTDPLIVGRFMFHCHVPRHEDKGMMANIEVYDPIPPSLSVRMRHFYLHVLWWWRGVPWSLCGLADT
jgi:FtsP/CotA-like multicopper oxidase with cupredoxin domain